MIRRLVAAVGLLVAGCGTSGGVIVEVSQSPLIVEEVDSLHLFVGTPDTTAGGFSGVALPDDVIALDTPLAERTHTIQLVAGGGLAPDTAVRIAVVGKSQDDVVGLGVLDVPRIPSDVFLQFPLELSPIDDVLMTESGCLVLPDGTVVAAYDDRDCDGVTRGDGDCDDLDPTIHPGAYDACAGESLGVDDDCNGTADDGDKDVDGADCTRDCDDQDPARTPGAREDCEGGVDNDCDFEIDEGVPEICDDQIDNDCDATTPDMSEVEICGDGYDNDCDLAVDEGRDGNDDVDQDGFNCAEDCNDDVGEINPNATEICNQNDDDCDDATDEDANDDQDPAPCLLDCNDGNEHMFPGNPEVCDTFNNDCVESTQPVPQPCLEYPGAGCTYGFRACNESQGVYGLCVADDTNDLPQEACDDFAPCDDSGPGLVCGGNPGHNCTQFVGTTTGEVCAAAFVPLTPPADAVACMWIIVGGPMQQGWTVGLIAEGATTPTATVATCNAQFTVVDVPSGFQPGTFIVIGFSGGLYDHSEVFNIVPSPTNVCPLPSLNCTPTT